ncbi:methylated-DNA--[protein]-cysteine S-methyltransferase [Candidatus Palauibacter sp.]|uniref:methylated-DNA--[protein]-cysteine S-methyltransferase n=1 Tax=Candidatus Palauibacter sp. TaxID=3101350 RepID=UPI003AF24A6D
MTGSCATYCDEDVLAWTLGDSDGSAAQELAEHLATCPCCRGRATEYRALDRSAGACREGPVIRWRGFDSPFGPMHLAASRDGLVSLSWQAPSDDAFVAALEGRYGSAPVVCDCGELAAAEEQLREYFVRRRRRFDLAIDLGGLTDFQRAVLGAASRLGFGETTTYTEIARRVGRPRASRAVGNALGRNPIPVVVPCHRVLRADRSLGGYTGGLRYKKALLDIEGRADLLPPAASQIGIRL